LTLSSFQRSGRFVHFLHPGMADVPFSLREPLQWPGHSRGSSSSSFQSACPLRARCSG
jgi:hypothetical protein